jgi:DNA modification methylase
MKVARDLGRNSIGIDIVPEFCDMAEQRVLDTSGTNLFKIIRKVI